MKKTKNWGTRLWSLALAGLLLAAVLPGLAAAWTCPTTATFSSFGAKYNVYIRYYGMTKPLGVLKMTSGTTTYDAYCVDLFKPISVGNILTVDGDLSDVSVAGVNWCAVNYILANYDYLKTYPAGHPLYGLDQNKRAAAIQAAIAYFTTAPYGLYIPGTGTGKKYQFMTDPVPTSGTNYDGYPVRANALAIVNSVPANCDDVFRYPDNIAITPASANACTNQQVTVTVTDQKNAVLPGVDVIFETNYGSFSSTSTVRAKTVKTDSDGTASVTLYNLAEGQTATITAAASGRYGTYIYDPANSKQSCSMTPLHYCSVTAKTTISCTKRLEVTKTANPTMKRTYAWTLDKKVNGADSATLNLFRGDTGSTDYTVTATRAGYTDSDWKVSGKITVKNPNPSSSVTISKLPSDVISKTGSADIPATVSCPGVTFPKTLSPGASFTCTYTANLPDGSTRTNKAKVTTSISNLPGTEGTATVDFANAQITKVHDKLDVVDTNGGSWLFTDTGTQAYAKSFTCDGDKGDHTNTVTSSYPDDPVPRPPGPTDSAKVTVNCHALTVTKDVQTRYTKIFPWTILKSVNPDKCVLKTGEFCMPEYTIAVTKGNPVYDITVQGTITILNPAPISAHIKYVSDLISGGIGYAIVSCPGGFPFDLGAGNSVTCSYIKTQKNVPDINPRTNTAIASLKNVPGGSTHFTGTADVTFGDPESVVNGEITVKDTNFPGEISGPYDTSYQWSYPLDFTCEVRSLRTRTLVNTATIIETGAHDSAQVVIECPETQRVPEFPSAMIPGIVIAGFALAVLGIRRRMPPGPK